MPLAVVQYGCTALVVMGLLLLARHNRKSGWRRVRPSPLALASYRECLAGIHSPVEWSPRPQPAPQPRPETVSGDLAALGQALAAFAPTVSPAPAEHVRA